VTTVILAKLIDPSDFGLVGMTMVFIGFAALFQDLGTTSFVVQIKEASDEFLSTIYWFNVSLAIILMIILYATADLIAKFYNEPEITTIVFYLAWIFPITSIGSVQQAILERELVFKKLSLLEMGATTIASVVGITCALNGLGALSLVFQSLTLSIFSSLLVFVFCDWKPKMHFKLKELKKARDFSLNLTGFNIYNYFARNADYFLIGKFLGSEALGLYTLAYNLMLVPIKNVSGAVSRVLYPVLSKFQDDHPSFRSVYLGLVRNISILTFPAMVGIVVISKPFFVSVLGAKWIPALPVIYILAPLGIIQSIINLNGSIYKAMGRTGLQFRFSLLFGSIIIVSFVIGLRWGVVGVAAAYAAASFLLSYPIIKIPYNLVGLRPVKLLNVLGSPLTCSILMGVIVFIPGYYFTWDSLPLLKIITLVLTGIAAYLLFSWYFNREGLLSFIALVKRKEYLK
jgi:PST family polysaccharide transporter